MESSASESRPDAVGRAGMNGWRILGCALWLLAPFLCMSVAQGDARQSVGEAIYRTGVLGSGAPLAGERADDAQSVHGAAAACVHCHRDSGLGSQEGDYAIPPISARSLYRARVVHAEHPDLPKSAVAQPDREAYADGTLARAIRSGVDPQGRVLGYLMPRFALDDSDMAALIAYLKTLGPGKVPGATSTVLHFATIITPDADPVKRRAMLGVLEHYFADQNTLPLNPAVHRQGQDRSLQPGGISVGNRHWRLHVWQLEGAPAGWEAQLQRRITEEPVMAVISGLGGSDWTPVHQFCQHARLPCLFPNLEVPVDANRDFYSLYFSKGVLLEAQLIARRIERGGPEVNVGPVQQMFRAGGSGEVAAHALASALQGAGIAVEDVALPAGPAGSGLREALQGADGSGALVLWLHPEDLAALPGSVPPRRLVFASGLMGGLEHAPLPTDWRGRVLLSYPFDLPERRIMRVDYPMGWFRLRNIPVLAEQVQVDTYVACGLLADALRSMPDRFAPEYLVERAEEIVGHRVLTGYYPRLSLAQGQRFASKGGYLVQLSGAGTGRLIPASGWEVP